MAKDYKIVDNVLIIDEGRTEISRYEFLGKIPKVTKVIIPEGVTKIEVDAFCGCKQLEEVVLPASLESIARNAFAHCPLKKVVIPEGVTQIGYWAFGGCKQLEEVVLPASLEIIAMEAFALCPLKEVIFTDGCPNLKEVYVGSFSGSPWEKQQRKEHEFFMFGTKLFMHGEGSSAVVIPNGVETIGESSFSEVESECVIEEVTIPEGVKIIERNAFSACEKLTSIHLPQSLESIGDFAFSGCEALKEIVLPDNLKTLGASVFNRCTSLERIVFPVKLKSIGENLFTGGYFSCQMNVKAVDGLIPAMLNGCKLNTKTSMWFLENLWKDENSLKEIAVLYLTQSGTKVLAQAELILWRNPEQAVSIMKELKNGYKLKPATIKKIDAFVEKYA